MGIVELSMNKNSREAAKSAALLTARGINRMATTNIPAKKCQEENKTVPKREAPGRNFQLRPFADENFSPNMGAEVKERNFK